MPAAGGETIQLRTSSTVPYRLSVCRLAGDVDQASGRGDRMSVPFTIRFHLHPDIEADVFLAGSAVRLRPPSGDIWVMRQLGGDLTVEDSVYLDDRRVRPRATKQIVVRAEAKAYAGLVKWAFRRAEPEKPAPRDLGEEAELDA